MQNQKLVDEYDFLELQRSELKKLLCKMKSEKRNIEEIEQLEKNLRRITLNQAKILVKE